jgi:hypothetical protein
MTRANMHKAILNQTFTAPAGPSKEQRDAEERKKEKMVNVLGAEVEARTLDDAKQLKDKSANIHTIVDKLTRMKALRARAGAVDLAGVATEDAKTAQTLMGTVMMDLKEYWKAGALDAGLLTFLESVVSKPNAWTQVMDQYEALEDAVVNKYSHDLNQLVRPDGEPYEFVAVKNMLQGFSNEMMKSMDVDAMIKAKRGAEEQSKKPAPPLPPVKMGTQAGSFGFGK